MRTVNDVAILDEALVLEEGQTYTPDEHGDGVWTKYVLWAIPFGEWQGEPSFFVSTSLEPTWHRAGRDEPPGLVLRRAAVKKLWEALP